jgi:DNA-binding transcriptional MerR regulator
MPLLSMPVPIILNRMNDVSAYLSSLFGGFTVDWKTILGSGLTLLLLTILYGRLETLWNRRRERIGLLRVIDAEVYENNEVLKLMITDPDLAEQYPSRRVSLSTNAWEQHSARLAQLLRREHIRSLVAHYASISRIKAALEDRNATIKAKTREQKAKAADIRKKRYVLLSSLANLAWLEGEAIRKQGKKYIGTLPDYFGTAEREAEKAAAADQPDDDGKDADAKDASPT